MNTEIMDEKKAMLDSLGRRAKRAESVMRTASAEDRNKALIACAAALRDGYESILSANAKDVETAKNSGMKESLVDRLMLTKERIDAMALGLEQVADLPDPLGCILAEFDRPNGLKIQKVSVPIGVIGIIYESRPNVTADAFALTFKSGNVSILKGGSDALASNRAISDIIRDTLKKCGMPEDAMLFIDSADREVATGFMRLHEYVDVLIPRGGAGLIRAAVENATIPVIETGTGNCHVYVDKSADIDMAVKIIHNAKTQRMGVCNACESLVIHKDIAERAIPAIAEDLLSSGIEIRGDAASCTMASGLKAASEDDFYTEYGDALISVCIVDSVEAAIEHINRCSTHHSEAIVTGDPESAEKFLNGVDSAAVYVNASTRFTDGFEFGFGAEIGISTQKLHARGPMGLTELTSYKYKVRGNGQIRG